MDRDNDKKLEPASFVTYSSSLTFSTKMTCEGDSNGVNAGGGYTPRVEWLGADSRGVRTSLVGGVLRLLLLLVRGEGLEGGG